MAINNATNNVPFVWTSVSADQQLVPNHAIINFKPTLLNLQLPTHAAVGTTIIVQGLGAGGWLITQGVGQQIIVGNQQTTVTTGSLASTMPSDSVSLVCTVADTIWSRFAQVGNLAIDGSSLIQTPYDALKNLFMWQHQKSEDNITGDMTEYRMTYPDLVFDVGGNFDGDSVFIAPETGIYWIKFQGSINGLDSHHTQMYTKILTQQFNFIQNRCNPYSNQSLADRPSFSFIHIQLIKMNAGEDLRTYISIGNGANSINLVEGSETDIVTAIAGYMIHSILKLIPLHIAVGYARSRGNSLLLNRRQVVDSLSATEQAVLRKAHYATLSR